VKYTRYELRITVVVRGKSRRIKPTGGIKNKSVMKTRVIIISILIAAIGFTAFGFLNKQQAAKVVNLDIKETSLKVDKAEIVDFSNAKKPMNNPNLSYLVKGRYSRPITIEKIQKAKLVSDLIEGYPNNWITAYISVEISSSCKKVKVNAVSLNDVLNTEQKSMLNNADVGTDIVISVKYNTKNGITDVLEKSEMNVSLTVIPEIEATYIGGYKDMIAYLKENSNAKIAAITTKQIQFTSINFTINKNGKADNVMLIKASGIAAVDELLIESITNMPKWIPAKNSKGDVVEQEFEFSLGSMAGGC